MGALRTASLSEPQHQPQCRMFPRLLGEDPGRVLSVAPLCGGRTPLSARTPDRVSSRLPGGGDRQRACQPNREYVEELRLQGRLDHHASRSDCSSAEVPSLEDEPQTLAWWSGEEEGVS